MSRLASCCVAAALLAWSAAQAADGLTAYFGKALQHDPDYAAAKAAYEADAEYRAIGRAGLLPSVNVALASDSNRLNRLDMGATQANDFRFNSRTASLRLSQPLFDLERWAAYKEGDARAAQAEVVLADARQDLALRVALAYFNLLLAADNLDLARAQREALIAQRIQAEHLFKSGIATLTDVEESKAREQLAQAQELAAVNALELRRKELGKAIGEAPSPAAAASIGMPLLATPEPDDLKAWVEAARDRNLKVLALRGQLAVADFQVDRARAGLSPSIALVASHQRGSQPDYLTERQTSNQIGVELSMNLIEGGRTTSLARQAAAQREKTRYDLESAVRDAEIKASQAYLEIVNGIAQVHALEQAVKSAEITLKGMEAGQRSGLRTNTDVLNAQQQLFSARRDLQRERYGYLMNRLQLLAAVGSINDAAIQDMDRLAGIAVR
ncbi:MAG: TolC family outer membrane protein [Rhodocyclaceae bacterium]|nr:TolC family outer membrane protein [Rhodocyclaceae bacterium]